MTTGFLNHDNHRLALRTTNGSNEPAFFWLSGFMSDMGGSKATALFDWASASKRRCRLFDYSGHGASSGTMAEFTLSRAIDEALVVFDDFAPQSCVLVGSSMGGWIALRLLQILTARKAATQIAGLLLIAPAPDFTERLLWPSLPQKAKNDILEKGVYYKPTRYGDTPYPITRALIEDGRRNLVLDKPFPVPCPVQILQGTKDRDVPPDHAMELMNVLDGNVTLSLIKDGDHRLSTPDNLAQMLRAAESLC